MVYKDIVKDLTNLFFPRRCVVTDQKLARDSVFQNISVTGLRLLSRIHTPCYQCGLPLPSFTPIACGQCQKDPPSFDRTICAFSYEEPLSQMILDFKFNQKLYYADFFAEVLSECIKNHYEVNNAELPQLIMPTPLHISRLQERGYNQAREVSRLLSKKLNILHEDKVFYRARATNEQSGLNAKQRRQNLRNAFALDGHLHIKHVALVDDVMTTGITAETMATELKQAGVLKVDIWAVARTPKP